MIYNTTKYKELALIYLLECIKFCASFVFFFIFFIFIFHSRVGTLS